MKPKYPIYIPSKGRYDSCITMRALDKIKVSYYVIVESQEVEKYSKNIDSNKLLILPKKFQDEYNTCDDVKGISLGSGPARNFAWEHAIQNGFARHWIIDDNISAFYRLNNNNYGYLATGSGFVAMENFTDRYTNIALSGPNYSKFVKSTDKLPPFITNTRIYSCILINNNIHFRWRARYNEDTDLSLRVLKNNYCTVQFNAFPVEKFTTMKITGGNTTELYFDGTKAKSEMIQKLHPDVARVSFKFNRDHHHVDYTGFKQKLVRVANFDFSGINNFGMKLVNLKNIGSGEPVGRIV